MNGPPKQAEKVASGSVTPTSVPASLEVKPVTKGIRYSLVGWVVGEKFK